MFAVIEPNRRIRWTRSLIILLLCLLFFTPVRTQAATNMGKTKGITWDLLPGKTLTYYVKMGGAGFIKQKLKISSYSSRYLANGDIGMTVTIDYTRTVKPSKARIKKLYNYYSKKGSTALDPRCWIALVDYKTGKSLLRSNDRGVTVSLKWEAPGSYKKYSAGRKAIYIKNTRVVADITFPRTYKDLCLGAGGWSRLKKTAKDTAFWNGTVPFWKTDTYRSKKQPKAAHFVRLSAD